MQFLCGTAKAANEKKKRPSYNESSRPRPVVPVAKRKAASHRHGSGCTDHQIGAGIHQRIPHPALCMDDTSRSLPKRDTWTLDNQRRKRFTESAPGHRKLVHQGGHAHVFPAAQAGTDLDMMGYQMNSEEASSSAQINGLCIT